MSRVYLKSSTKNSTVGFQAVLMRMVSGGLLLLSDTTKARKHLDPDPLILEAISLLCSQSCNRIQHDGEKICCMMKSVLT